MDSIERELIEALERIEELCDGGKDSTLREEIGAIVEAALDKAAHHARLCAMGAFNDE